MVNDTQKHPHRWLALTAMSLGTFMGLLDVTVVNVALPTMVRQFNTSFTNLQWVLNAYTLVYAVSLMIMSKLGDMYGRKKIFFGLTHPLCRGLGCKRNGLQFIRPRYWAWRSGHWWGRDEFPSDGLGGLEL